MTDGPRTTKKRALAKTITWRVAATLDTFLISLFITGSFAWASSIASIEVLTKMFLYYGHERLWDRLSWGLKPGG